MTIHDNLWLSKKTSKNKIHQISLQFFMDCKKLRAGRHIILIIHLIFLNTFIRDTLLQFSIRFGLVKNPDRVCGLITAGHIAQGGVGCNRSGNLWSAKATG